MATMILIEKPVAAEIASVYRERLMSQAELAAKKELVTMANKIDKAASEGKDSVFYRLSNSVTRLSGAYRTAAFDIIDADIKAGGYTYTFDGKGYDLSWGEVPADDDNQGTDPVNPDQGGNNTNPDQGGDNTDPNEGGNGGTEPVNPEPVNPEPVDEDPVLTPAEDQNPDHYEAVEVLVGGEQSPVEEGWYELVNGEYALSADAVADMEKTYYRLKDETEWEPVPVDDLEPLPEP